MTRLRYPLGLLIVTQLCAITSIESIAYADFIPTLTLSTTAGPSGLTEYDYTLANPVDSDLPVGDLILGVDPTADLQNISGPTGWTIYYNPGDSTVEWSSPSSATDLIQGGTTLFSFDSYLPPGDQNYLLSGFSDSPPYVETSFGDIQAPTADAVPEPSTGLMIGLGIISILVRSSSNRRNR